MRHLISFLLIGAILSCTRRPDDRIGVASMKPDGTLVLDLRARGDGGMKGDARLEYPPSHPRYQEILKHIAPIQPGESKPVAPWPK